MLDKNYTYDSLDDEDSLLDDVWDYPDINDDEAIERFIENRRIEFREEWNNYWEYHRDQAQY
jgi:DNA-binding response OmpR family regulator